MEGKKRTSAHTLPPSASLHAEIGGANGPQQLSALVLQFGPHLNPQHLSTALSKLAGFAVGAAGGGGLPAEDAEAVARTASRCAAVLRYKCDQLVDPLQVWGECERAAPVKCHCLCFSGPAFMQAACAVYALAPLSLTYNHWTTYDSCTGLRTTNHTIPGQRMPCMYLIACTSRGHFAPVPNFT